MQRVFFKIKTAIACVLTVVVKSSSNTTLVTSILKLDLIYSLLPWQFHGTVYGQASGKKSRRSTKHNQE